MVIIPWLPKESFLLSQLAYLPRAKLKCTTLSPRQIYQHVVKNALQMPLELLDYMSTNEGNTKRACSGLFVSSVRHTGYPKPLRTCDLLCYTGFISQTSSFTTTSLKQCQFGLGVGCDNKPYFKTRCDFLTGLLLGVNGILLLKGSPQGRAVILSWAGLPRHHHQNPHIQVWTADRVFIQAIVSSWDPWGQGPDPVWLVPSYTGGWEHRDTPSENMMWTRRQRWGRCDYKPKKPKMAPEPPEVGGEPGDRFIPTALRRNQSTGADLKLPASRTVRQYISVI